MDYQQFLEHKRFMDVASGHHLELAELNQRLFPFQKVLTRWALGRGRSAIFADTGLGKTAMQVEWANQVNRHTKRPVLILAPRCGFTVVCAIRQAGGQFCFTLVLNHALIASTGNAAQVGEEKVNTVIRTESQEDPISFQDEHYSGPERRQGMQQWDKLKLHGALMADALLHPDQYNQAERDALVAHFHAIASRL